MVPRSVREARANDGWWLRAVLLGAALAALGGCAPHQETGPARSARGEGARSIPLLQGFPCDRPYEELRRVSYTGPRPEGVLYLKRRTRALGGDAVVLVAETDQGVERHWEGWTAYTVPIKRLRGVAIRYR